ncbi:CPBP family intramembrane metalloprotease [uncultured Microbacterium sp.]|uniref:CPBP family intramembrane metalloprotease n=1 Tax=uncultured Microbacterium sp. TaxID=191216 RepID=UPI0025E71608|nr:CPBP family intramembrane metalloprotease [uncultured Microbacterium sp.]
MLLAAAVGGGIGVLAAVLVARISALWAPTVSLLALWAGLLGAVVWAFVRARPAGILTFRPTDLVWGLGVGLGLRLLQGLSSGANSAPFPSSTSFSGILPVGDVPDVFTAGFAGPVIEEFFFRAVLLIALYQLFRRSLGHVAAGVTAIFTSAGAFICLHAAFGALTLSGGLQLFLVGVACSGLVIMTGRIWGAVLAHIVYNVSFVLLGVLGTALA